MQVNPQPPGSRQFGCFVCRQSIGAQQEILFAKQGRCHKSCFTCSTCSNPLTPQTQRERDHQLYCVKCYHQKFSALCQQCHEPLEQNAPVIEKDDHRFHQQCFVCFACRRPLKDPYCRYINKCYHLVCLMSTPDHDEQRSSKLIMFDSNQLLVSVNQPIQRPQTTFEMARPLRQSTATNSDHSMIVSLNLAEPSALTSRSPPQTMLSAAFSSPNTARHSQVSTARTPEKSLAELIPSRNNDAPTGPLHSVIPRRRAPVVKRLILPSIQKADTQRSHNSLFILPAIVSTVARTCTICVEDKPLNEYATVHNSQCVHEQRTICDTCVHEHIIQTFANPLITDYHCMEPDCGATFEHGVLQRILTNPEEVELFNRYDRFCRDQLLQSSPDFVWCAHECGCGQFVDDGAANNIISCVKCDRKTCYTHRLQWHEGQTCAEYDKKHDLDSQATEKWLAQCAKRCPNCRINIEKADGCDHMRCKCLFEFCWNCLADFDAIRQDGNHRHDPACKHYFPLTPGEH